MSLDRLFYKEFKETMAVNRQRFGTMSLGQIPLPENIKSLSKEPLLEKVFIRGLDEDYFKELNDRGHYWLKKGNLRRRQFNYKGFKKDKKGGFIYEDVTIPRGFTAIATDVNIKVPEGYKSQYGCEYIDYVVDKKGVKQYMYIVPKEKCFELNQVSLVLSTKALRSHYGGVSLVFNNGQLVYLFLVPFNQRLSKLQRVLVTRSSLQFPEMLDLSKFWIAKGYLLNPNFTGLEEEISGRTNCVSKVFQPTLELYEKYDEHKPLSQAYSEIDDIV